MLQDLFAAALDNPLTQKVIAPLALEAFGCMRPEEVESIKAFEIGEAPFTWDDIDLENGLCNAGDEDRDERTIRLQPNCVEWLKLAKGLENPLPPVNERRLVDQCCELIDLEDWIRDGLRKCCATHLRNVYKNDYDVRERLR